MSIMMSGIICVVMIISFIFEAKGNASLGELTPEHYQRGLIIPSGIPPYASLHESASLSQDKRRTETADQESARTPHLSAMKWFIFPEEELPKRDKRELTFTEPAQPNPMKLLYPPLHVPWFPGLPQYTSRQRDRQRSISNHLGCLHCIDWNLSAAGHTRTEGEHYDGQWQQIYPRYQGFCGDERNLQKSREHMLHKYP